MPPLALVALFQRSLPWLSPQGRAVINSLVCDNGRAGSTNLLCERLGLRTRFQLNRLLHREGLPPYEELTGWVCVLHWMLRADAGAVQGGGALRPIAREARMALASCYRLVRRVTGHHWTRLRKVGTSEVMHWFVERTCIPHAPRPIQGQCPTVELHEPAQLRERPPIGTPRRLPICGAPFGIAIRGPDLAYVTRTRAAAVERLDLLSGRFCGSVQLGCTPTCVKFDASGDRAYVSVQYCDEIAVIDTHRHVRIHAFPIAGNPFPLALSQRAHTLFVTTNEDRLFGLNVQNGRLLGSVPLPATSHHLALHPSGDRLYVATRIAGSVLEIDTSRYEVIRTFALGGWPQGVAVSSDGTTLYVANERHGLDVVRLASGKRIGTVELDTAGSGAVSLALSPDNRLLYTGLVHCGKVAAIDVGSQTLRAVIDTGGRPREIAFDSAGKAIVVNEAGWIDILPADGAGVYRLGTPSNQPTAPAAAAS